MNWADIQSRIKVAAVSFTTQMIVGVVDYCTGYELNVNVLYFIPVSICAWHLRRLEIFGSALLGAITWGIADERAGHHYSSQQIWFCNVLFNFASLLVVGFVVRSLRENQLKQEQARKALAESLARLQASAAEVEKLQSQLQVVCAWSHRIQVADKWVTFEEFLHDYLKIPVSHGISPEALAELSKDIGEKTFPPKT